MCFVRSVLQANLQETFLRLMSGDSGPLAAIQKWNFSMHGTPYYRFLVFLKLIFFIPTNAIRMIFQSIGLPGPNGSSGFWDFTDNHFWPNLISNMISHPYISEIFKPHQRATITCENALFPVNMLKYYMLLSFCYTLG